MTQGERDFEVFEICLRNAEAFKNDREHSACFGRIADWILKNRLNKVSISELKRYAERNKGKPSR